jgi:hypothetical protein
MFLRQPCITFSFKESDEKPLVLATQEVTGDRHYDFKLSAWHQKDGGCNFEILGVPNSEEHQEKSLYCPCFALPELRQKMVKILVEHDGSERIDKMPKIPEWATSSFSANSKFSYNYSAHSFHSHSSNQSYAYDEDWWRSAR